MLLKPIFPVISFMVNYDYIAKELCENKTKPELHCNGKCYLKKELAKASENTNPTSQDKKQVHLEQEILFLEIVADFDFQNIRFHDKKCITTHYSNRYTHLNSHAVFHPPILS
ncbi:hypothetical protein Q762_02540 [Flavobacterium cauense R2A-7]|nr:hypothetical protein Q762_02540 [Flavobacterium cauense R2A-7]